MIQARNDQSGEIGKVMHPIEHIIHGIAPQCRLLSFKVLNADGRGKTSSVIEAIGAIQRINDFGRRILVHGVNLSLGYPFMPEWFACGQSPLCMEVNRLVKSGVVVVAAAGNSGYGSIDAISGGIGAGGSAAYHQRPWQRRIRHHRGIQHHRDMPHTYGVSYFSSKGPTGDGRLKPDPGSRPASAFLSCAAGTGVDYVEDTGTSMAAPHVSGVIAAFLSIRREFIGKPEEVKKIFKEQRDGSPARKRPHLPGERPCGSDAGHSIGMNHTGKLRYFEVEIDKSGKSRRPAGDRQNPL